MIKFKIQDKDVLLLKICNGTILYKYVLSKQIEQSSCIIFNRLTGSDFFDDDTYEIEDLNKHLK